MTRAGLLLVALVLVACKPSCPSAVTATTAPSPASAATSPPSEPASVATSAPSAPASAPVALVVPPPPSEPVASDAPVSMQDPSTVCRPAGEVPPRRAAADAQRVRTFYLRHITRHPPRPVVVTILGEMDHDNARRCAVKVSERLLSGSPENLPAARYDLVFVMFKVEEDDFDPSYYFLVDFAATPPRVTLAWNHVQPG